MKILVVSPYVPHRDAGHGTGAFMDGLLRRLAARHDVTLATFYDDVERPFLRDFETSRIHLRALYRPRGRRATAIANAGLILQRARDLARSFFTWTPYYAEKWHDRRMHRLVEELTKTGEFDIVQLELAFMAGYVPAVRQGGIVLHEHDVAYRPAYRRFRRAPPGITKVLRYLDWCMWSSYELEAVKRVDGVLAVTEQDQHLLEHLTHASHIGYLPRAVEPPSSQNKTGREPATVLFVGSFAHAPNVDAALEIIRSIAPSVWAVLPETRFILAGPNPPNALKEMARPHKNISVAGFVEDLGPLMRQSTVFLAPLRSGGGVKVKLLHAMSYAIPVVTTSLGAEGIEGAVPGESLLIGRTAADLATAVCGLLRDPARAAALGRAGFAAMERYYSWDRVLSTLDEFYLTILQKRKA